MYYKPNKTSFFIIKNIKKILSLMTEISASPVESVKEQIENGKMDYPDAELVSLKKEYMDIAILIGILAGLYCIGMSSFNTLPYLLHVGIALFVISGVCAHVTGRISYSVMINFIYEINSGIHDSRNELIKMNGKDVYKHIQLFTLGMAMHILISIIPIIFICMNHEKHFWWYIFLAIIIGSASIDIWYNWPLLKRCINA